MPQVYCFSQTHFAASISKSRNRRVQPFFPSSLPFNAFTILRLPAFNHLQQPGGFYFFELIIDSFFQPSFRLSTASAKSRLSILARTRQYRSSSSDIRKVSNNHLVHIPSDFITMFSRGLRTTSRGLLAASNRPVARITRAVQTRAATPTMARSYHDKVLDHYERPRNTGSLPKADTDVGTGLVGAPACGDVMKLQIRVDPQSQVISDVRFKTFGCGSAIASSSYLTELVKGMTLEEAARVKNTDIARELCLPPVKRMCNCGPEE